MLERVLPVVLIVAVVVAAGLFLYLGQKGEEKPSEFPPLDKLQFLGKIPDGWSVTSLDGKEISARDLRGKVLFINRWATWCPPCMAEMPSIEALYKSLAGANVAFIVVSTEKADKVQQAVAKHAWTMPIYLATERFPPVLESEAIPATFIADRQGRIVFREIGGKNWNTDDARGFLTKIP